MSVACQEFADIIQKMSEYPNAASWVQALIYLLTLIVLLWQVIILNRQTRQAERSRIHQVLAGILTEYRSAEMGFAIARLREIHATNPTGFVNNYEARDAEERAMLSALSCGNRLSVVREMLHYQRRVVSHFFAFLAGLHYFNIIPKDMLYTYWTESDLRIIPEVLIPIERRLIEKAGEKPDEVPALSILQQLYFDCPGASRHSGEGT